MYWNKTRKKQHLVLVFVVLLMIISLSGCTAKPVDPATITDPPNGSVVVETNEPTTDSSGEQQMGIDSHEPQENSDPQGSDAQPADVQPEDERVPWTTDLFDAVPRFEQGTFPTEEEFEALFRNANLAGNWFVSGFSVPLENPGRKLIATEGDRSEPYSEVNHDFATSMEELREKLHWFFTDAQIDRIFASQNGFENEFKEIDGVLGINICGIGSDDSLGETTLREARVIDETHIETVWATEQLDEPAGKPTGEYRMHTFALVWENGLWLFDTFAMIGYE